MRLITFIVILSIGFAHSGRTDKYGGHNNRKTGGYHYHNSGSLHAAANPYQDHKNCGICKPKFETKSTTVNNRLPSYLPSKTEVVLAQSCLLIIGYYSGELDGVLGKRTHEAIPEFQKTEGLTVTGKIDKETISILLLRTKDKKY